MSIATTITEAQCLECLTNAMAFDTVSADIDVKVSTTALNEVGGWIQTDGNSTININQENTAKAIVDIAVNCQTLADMSDDPTVAIVTYDMLQFTNHDYLNNPPDVHWSDYEYINNWIKEKKLESNPDVRVISPTEVAKYLKKYYDVELTNMIENITELSVNIKNIIKATVTITQSNKFDYNIARATNSGEVDINMKNEAVVEIYMVLDEMASNSSKGNNEGDTINIENKYITGKAIFTDDGKVKIEYEEPCKALVKYANDDKEATVIYSNYPKVEFDKYIAVGKTHINNDNMIAGYNDSEFIHNEWYIAYNTHIKHTNMIIEPYNNTYVLENKNNVQYVKLEGGQVLAFITNVNSFEIFENNLKLPSELDENALFEQEKTIGLRSNDNSNDNSNTTQETTTTPTPTQTETTAESKGGISGADILLIIIIVACIGLIIWGVIYKIKLRVRKINHFKKSVNTLLNDNEGDGLEQLSEVVSSANEAFNENAYNYNHHRSADY